MVKTILVTGVSGIIGRNLIEALERSKKYKVQLYRREMSDDELKGLITQADYLFHLAGVSRPTDPKDFYLGNSFFTKRVVDCIQATHKKLPIFFTSSISVEVDNDFGKSKRDAENILKQYGKDNEVEVSIIRLTNTFGKWAKVGAHSVIATFCYNVAHDLPITVLDSSKVITLAYVDEVTEAFVGHMEHRDVSALMKLGEDGYYSMVKTYPRQLGQIADLLYLFKKENGLPSSFKDDDFAKKLYTTYVSYASLP